MTNDHNKSESKSKVLPVATIIVLALLLLGIAYRWVGSAPRTIQQTSPTGMATAAAPIASQINSVTVTPPAAKNTAIPPLIPTAAATIAPTSTQLPPPEFSNPVQDAFQQVAAAWDAELVVSDLTNTGLWQFAEDTLVHPLALETRPGFAYLIDSGRVLEIDLQDARPPRVLLAPGDDVEGVLVMEPLDLALSGDYLFVLDRAGDVYATDLLSGTWQLDRYDRPVEESSGHYFVALDAARLDGQTESTKALLETNYKFAQLYDNEETRIWRLPELRSIDLSYVEGDVYVLQRELHDQAGTISKYRDTSSIPSFRPRIEIEEPRQVEATTEGIYILDQGGRRLLLLDPQYGTLLRVYQPPQDAPISAFTHDVATGTLLLAAQDRLYFLGEPEHRTTLGGGSESERLQSHDYYLLAELDDFVVPIGGSNITFRDFQMPGAPRHYRLGVHNGLDFYWQPGTKVVAAGDGKVVRADVDYVDPSAADLALWSSETSQQGYTPDEILDKYLGRQVWIEHESGVLTRYAHLRNIEPGIAPGVSVSRGKVIGEVGNSGSPASLEGESSDAHLHFELWLGDTFLGQYLRPIETRDWIEQVFPASR